MMKRAFIASLVLAAGCSSTPEMMPEDHGWQKVKLTADDEKADPLKLAPKLIDEREKPGSLDHAIALLNWHLDRHPDSAALHQLLAEAHSRYAESLDPTKADDKAAHAYHRTEGLKH